MDLVIYGAQGIALGTYKAIKCLYPKRVVECFLVSELGINRSTLSGIPVKEVETFAKNISIEQKNNIEVLIATPVAVMNEIEECLDHIGLLQHVRMESERWNELMESYYIRTDEYTILKTLPIGYNQSEIQMYMTKFYKDRALNTSYQLPEYVIPIQVGTALCNTTLANILDNEGDNISTKNVNYSELTGLYWIWKNKLKSAMVSEDGYYSLIHYRRVFSLSKDDELRLRDNGVDVVLPLPMPYEPNIEEHHKRYLKESDWNALLCALNELQPQYFKKFKQILSQEYMFNYNIIIAKAEILDKYCSWLFPILERIEELSTPRACDRADRYIGYMGETLLTLYFMYNKEKYNIVHTGCVMLE